jgi:hypothetical protein
MAELSDQLRSLLEAGQATEALEIMTQASGLETRQAVFVEALCHCMNRDFFAAELVFEDTEFDDQPISLLRARIAFELGKNEEAALILESVDESPGQDSNWLLFCSRATQYLEGCFGSGSHPSQSEALRQMLHGVDDSKLDDEEAGDLKRHFKSIEPVLQCFAKINLRLARLLRETELPHKEFIEELQSLIALLANWDPQGQGLRRKLVVMAGISELRAGRRQEAFSKVREQLGLEGDRGELEDWIHWGEFLHRGEFPEAVVLRAYLRAHTLHKRRASPSDSGELGTALALAKIYAHYGYGVEARSLLLEYYQAASPGRDWEKAMREVMVGDATLVGELAVDGLFALDAIPDELCQKAEPIEMDREPLSLLFLKAERCYAHLGAEHGQQILATAKKLKSALKDRDYDLTRSYENRLTRLVIKIYEEIC